MVCDSNVVRSSTTKKTCQATSTTQFGACQYLPSTLPAIHVPPSIFHAVHRHVAVLCMPYMFLQPQTILCVVAVFQLEHHCRCLTPCELAGSVLKTNQYSVTEYDTPAAQGELQLPSVWFLYDLSPVTVVMAQTRRSLLHLLTRFCAVVGGVFALTGICRVHCLLIDLLCTCI